MEMNNMLEKSMMNSYKFSILKIILIRKLY